MRTVFIALALPAGICAAQEGSPPGASWPDSIAVESLDEQLPPAPDGEDELEREDGAATVGKFPSVRDWTARYRLRGSGILQEPKGFVDGMFDGSRWKLSQRLSVRLGPRFSGMVLLEKDPGERSPAEFMTGVIAVRDLPGGLGVVAGDFRPRTGQGLLFGIPRAAARGPDVIGPAQRGGWGLPDGVSSDESFFFRGLAVSAAAGPVSVLAFSSWRRLTPVLSNGMIRGIDPSGYHRTASERQREGGLSESALGGSVRVGVGGVSLGFGMLCDRFEALLDARLERRSEDRWSADFRAELPRCTFYGEISGESSGAPLGRASCIGGVLARPPGGPDLVVVARSYPSGDAFRPSRGFGGNARPVRGVYAGAEFPVAAGVVLSGFLDVASEGNPGTRVPFRSSSLDRFGSLRWKAPGGFTMEARFRSRIAETRLADSAGGLSSPRHGRERTDRLRLQFEWKGAPGASCILRIERAAVRTGSADGSEGGTAASALLGMGSGGPASVTAGLSLFATDSFAAGISSVEPDLPGTVSLAVLSGEGAAWFVAASYAWPGVRVAAKYSRLVRDDLTRIGLGSAMLPSNVREKAGVQIDLGF